MIKSVSEAVRASFALKRGDAVYVDPNLPITAASLAPEVYLFSSAEPAGRKMRRMSDDDVRKTAFLESERAGRISGS